MPRASSEVICNKSRADDRIVWMVDKKLWDTQNRYFTTNENKNNLAKIIRTRNLMYIYQKTVTSCLCLCQVKVTGCSVKPSEGDHGKEKWSMTFSE